MTGPDHYRAAEELIEEARKAPRTGGEASADRFARLITEAQAHATLAVAAATAVKSPTDGHAWVEVAGAKLSGGS